jgi:hypothetical protein
LRGEKNGGEEKVEYRHCKIKYPMGRDFSLTPKSFPCVDRVSANCHRLARAGLGRDLEKLTARAGCHARPAADCSGSRRTASSTTARQLLDRLVKRSAHHEALAQRQVNRGTRW